MPATILLSYGEGGDEAQDDSRDESRGWLTVSLLFGPAPHTAPSVPGTALDLESPTSSALPLL